MNVRRLEFDAQGHVVAYMHHDNPANLGGVEQLADELRDEVMERRCP